MSDPSDDRLVSHAGALRYLDRGKAAWVTALLIVSLLFLLSVYILWRDFTGRWGLVASFLQVGVTRERAEPLAAVTFIGVLPACAMAWHWRGAAAIAAATTSARTCWMLLGAGVVLTLLALWALRGFANSGDEYAYTFQAETFLRGRTWNPLLPGQDLLRFNWILQKDGKWVSQYPPGWPLLLAGIRWLGVPFRFANVGLGAVLLLVLMRFCRRQEGNAVACISLIPVALSPFFAFNAASYFDHIPAALFGLLLCCWGARFIAEPTIGTALLTGAALGAIGLLRPFDVLLFAPPFAVECLLRGRIRHYRCAGAIVLGGLPFLVTLLAYNRAVTGHALLMPNL